MQKAGSHPGFLFESRIRSASTLTSRQLLQVLARPAVFTFPSAVAAQNASFAGDSDRWRALQMSCSCFGNRVSNQQHFSVARESVRRISNFPIRKYSVHE
jgi:hypothetical protein